MAWTQKFWIAGGLGLKDGSSEANAWDTAALLTNAAAGNRVEMKASTDANTTTARNFTNAGTTTQPIWFRGYKTTPGDMDAQPTSTRVAGTDIPSITFTTALMTISGAHQIWSNIDISGARTAGTQLSITAAPIMRRVRVENTGANAASSAISIATANGTVLEGCWFKATSTATRVVQVAQQVHSLGCVYRGGGIGFDMTTSASVWLYGNAFISTGGAGISSVGTVGAMYLGNSFYHTGGDGMVFSVLPTAQRIVIANNVFSTCNGYDINNSSGANTNFITRFANASYAPVTAHENGMGDSPDFFLITESAEPFTSSTDLSLVSGSLARAAGIMGRFENESFTGYASSGAVQLAAGGGGGLVVPQMRGIEGVHFG